MGIAILVFRLWSRLQSNGLEFGGSIITVYLFTALVFYVLGIIGWLLPYLLLALILLIWSFRSQAEGLMKIFALAPVAMTILIIAFVNILSPTDQSWYTFAPNPENVLGSNLLFLLLTLAWVMFVLDSAMAFIKLCNGWDSLEIKQVLQPCHCMSQHDRKRH